MDRRTEAENKIDDDTVMPGFRFHPTDEELVGFYLKRKIQERNLPFELIRQVDIYKYDPWDLPKLAASGEKDWYFYCPRDRKYRNSTRPNRVTRAGFWKATGTDRPVYSLDGTKCIGLKKSLVFYKGRAANGSKTDWMMHEFRLPSNFQTGPAKKNVVTNFLPFDSWALCRIFKKTNSITHRALAQNWISTIPEMESPDMLAPFYNFENASCTTETSSSIHYFDPQQSEIKIPSNKRPGYSNLGDCANSFMFSSPEIPETSTKCSYDIASMFFDSRPVVSEEDVSKTSGGTDLEGSEKQFNSFSNSSSLREMQGAHMDDEWENISSIAFSLSFPSSESPWISPCIMEM